ncbi:SDR family oxidoreductase [Halosimplex amylolyticum]|uniref:SDR family oxidoreductase n=1 Tax=Halosimplex amylolyticum TaxID=3396616 RepID=UPI003F5567A3
MTKTALITGSSSGIGRATAVDFLRREWTVYATARDTDDVADLAEAGCETAELDVTSDADVERVVDRIAAETGRIDCLVNNAGYAQYGPIEDVPVEAVRDQFDVNVYGPHRLTRAVLPHMRKRGSGTIVNVSSVQGRVATGGTGAYSGSKFALEAMSDALRVEVEDFGIDVVLVEPGPVATAFGDRAETEFDRLERSGAYHDLYSVQEDTDVLGSGNDFGVHPSEVAAVIGDAACASDPDPRYPVGTLASVMIATRHLPDRWRDAAYRLVRWVVT